MTEAKARATAARLRELIARGASLRQAAVKLGQPQTTLHRVAVKEGIRRRRPNMLPATVDRRIRAKLKRGQPQRAIARAERVSFDAVHRRWLQFLERAGAAHLPTTPWRCPKCGGMSTVDPCVADGTRRPRSRPRPGTSERRREAG